MANRFYSVATFGNDSISGVVESAATQAANVVELRVIYDGANASKQATVRAIRTLLFAVTKDTWPPV